MGNRENSSVIKVKAFIFVITILAYILLKDSIKLGSELPLIITALFWYELVVCSSNAIFGILQIIAVARDLKSGFDVGKVVGLIDVILSTLIYVVCNYVYIYVSEMMYTQLFLMIFMTQLIVIFMIKVILKEVYNRLRTRA